MPSAFDSISLLRDSRYLEVFRQSLSYQLFRHSPIMAPSAPLKRKQPPQFSFPTPSSSRAAKRVKTSAARTILAQASNKALSKNGDLDVSAFVKAREFEIRAMAASMGASKDSLSTRAFQLVPRDLRRRTASHNVKKVPKRLRVRAAREVRRAHKYRCQRT